MTITEAFKKLDELLERIREENRDIYTDRKTIAKQSMKIEFTYDDYLALLYLYTELKQIQETIVRLGWQKWERGE